MVTLYVVFLFGIFHIRPLSFFAIDIRDLIDVGPVIEYTVIRTYISDSQLVIIADNCGIHKSNNNI